jgi:hypothetical protein
MGFFPAEGSKASEAVSILALTLAAAITSFFFGEGEADASNDSGLRSQGRDFLVDALGGRNGAESGTRMGGRFSCGGVKDIIVWPVEGEFFDLQFVSLVAYKFLELVLPRENEFWSCGNRSNI